MIYQVNSELRRNLASFFESMTDTMILSCIQGHMGEAWVDNLENPTMIELIVGEFVFLAGKAKGEEAEELIINIPINSFILAENKSWGNLIENFYSECVTKIKRYSFLKDKKHLDYEYIKSLIDNLPKGYELKKADKEFLDKYSIEKISEDFVAQFNSVDDYLNRGIGYYIVKDGEVVSGASSYSIYDDGIEIEIDTDVNHRNKRLATVVAAALIIDCLDNGLYPSWDAANLTSLKLAKKLGYKFNEEYEVYNVNYKNA